MKKFFLQFFILTFLAMVGMVYTFQPQWLERFNIFVKSPADINPFPVSSPSPTIAISEAKQLKINQTVINIEVADTDSKRSLGLSNRDSLAPNSGMLFVFPKSDSYKFWMKGMLIPLDFIWIQNNKVVDITENVQAPVAGSKDKDLKILQPKTEVNRILEINAGGVAGAGIKIGDMVEVIY